MRRYRLALLGAGLLAATGQGEAHGQLFRKQSGRPAVSAAPAPPDAAVAPGRSARHLLRNGLDYLHQYGDVERAITFLEAARKGQSELSAAERQQLAEALLQAKRIRGGLEQAQAPTPRRAPASLMATRTDGRSRERNPDDQGPNPLLPPLPADEPLLARTQAVEDASVDTQVQVAANSRRAPIPRILGPTTPAQPAHAVQTNEVPFDVLSIEVPADTGLERAEHGMIEPQRHANRAERVDIPNAPPAASEPPPPQPIGLTIISEPGDYLNATPAEPETEDLAEPPPLPVLPAQEEPRLKQDETSAPEQPSSGVETLDAVQAPSAPVLVEPAPAAQHVEQPRSIIVTPEPAPRRDTGILLIPPPPRNRRQEPKPEPESGTSPLVEEPLPTLPVPEQASEAARADVPETAEQPQQGTHAGGMELPEVNNHELPELPAPPPALPAIDPAPVAASPVENELPQLPEAPPASVDTGSYARSILGTQVSPLAAESVMIRRPESARQVEELARRQELQDRQNPLVYPPDQETRGSEASEEADIPRAPSPNEARPIKPIPVPDEFIPFEQREFAANRIYWASPGTCYMPLYFQDAALERYGLGVEEALGPHWGRYFSYPLDDPRQSTQRNQILQPAYSAGLFILQLAALPIHMVLDPPWEAQYDLGYHRPGDPVPPDTIYWPKKGLGPPFHGAKY